MRRAHIGHTQPTNNAVRRDGSPLECSGAFHHGLLGRDPATAPDAPGWRPDRLALELGWGVVLPGGGEFTPFSRWSRGGTDGYRIAKTSAITIHEKTAIMAGEV